MRKIPTLFVRDFARDNGRYVTDAVTPGCEWVLAGEGVATRKYDGTCVMMDAFGKWWARREVKPSKEPPRGFRPVETDETTGKVVGWEPIEQSPFARFHAEAAPWHEPGTYELIGPKINGNPERRDRHVLVPHAEAKRYDMPLPLSFASIAAAVSTLHSESNCEGIVWHHPDGRMAKIKARDFRAGEGS